MTEEQEALAGCFGSALDYADPQPVCWICGRPSQADYCPACAERFEDELATEDY